MKGSTTGFTANYFLLQHSVTDFSMVQISLLVKECANSLTRKEVRQHNVFPQSHGQWMDGLMMLKGACNDHL
jgi:hypothetical protein